MANHGEYVCDTCKTVYNAEIVPIIMPQVKTVNGDTTVNYWPMMTIEQVTTFVDIVRRCFDPYWMGNQGVTTARFIAGLEDFKRWRALHKCHRVRLMKKHQEAPRDYKRENKGGKIIVEKEEEVQSRHCHLNV